MDIAQHNIVVLDFIQRAQRANIVPHQITAATGELLAVLERCLQAKRVLEIGTLWGYSTWWLYQGVVGQVGAQIITIEKERKHSTLAQQFFTATKLAAVGLRVGDAVAIIPEFAAASFDFIFLDADRRDYATLLPDLVRVLRPGGLFVIDNVAIKPDHVNTGIMANVLRQLQAQPNMRCVELVGATDLWLGLRTY